MGVADLIISGALKKKKKEENTYNVKDGTYTAEAVKSTNKKVKDTVDTFNNVSDRIKSNTTMSFDDDTKTYKTKSTITDEEGNVTYKKPKKEEKKNIETDSKGNVSILNTKAKPETNKNIVDNAAMITKSVGLGGLGGLTGIVDSPFQSMQEGAEKAKTKSKQQNIIESLLKYEGGFASDLANIPDFIKNTTNTLQDKDKSGFNKATNIGMDLLNNLSTSQKLLEGAGQISQTRDKNHYKDILNARRLINDPYENASRKFNRELDNYGKFTQTASELGQTIGNMIPSMAATAVTKNPNIGLVTMGYGAKGQATREAENKGADISTANDIGFAKGLTEVGTETLTGGLKFFGKGTADDLVEKGINNIIRNPLGNFIAKQAAGGLGEVLEEEISDTIGFAIDKATTNPDAKWSWSDRGKTALMTLLSTGILNTISGGYSRQAYQLNEQELKNISENPKVKQKIDNTVNQVVTPDMTPQEVEQVRQEVTATILGEIQDNVDNAIDNSIQEVESPNQTLLYDINQGVSEQNVQTPYEEEIGQITPLNEINQELQEVRQNDIEDSVQALNLEEDVDEDINTVETLEEETIANSFETYLKENNIENLTKEDIQNFIQKAIEEQGNISEEQKVELQNKYFDSIMNYIDKKIKPVETPETPIQETEQQIKPETLNEETPNTYIKNVDNRITPESIKQENKTESKQNNISEQFVNQFKSNENKAMESLDKTSKMFNLDKTKEFTQKEGNYVYVSHENPKIDAFRRSAATYMTNSPKTQNFVRTLEKIIKDKNVEIRFNPNLRDSKGRIANGSYSNGIITLNPNSTRAGEFLAIHELTHAIGTKSMIKMIENYRKSNAEFDSAVKKLLTTYKATEINEEALADISGQLFGNQEYINKLSTENKNLFNKLYNEIKYLWHQLRGYKNQNEFIEDLYHKWDQAYRRQNIKNTNKTGYSINEKTGLLQDSKGNAVTLETSNIGNTGTLMAMHNISEDKFNGVLDLDGIPVPSIAITNPSKVNHSQFGDGTLIFGKSTIDPAVRENEVYDRDVWSPTFPQIDNEIIEENLEKVADEIGIRDYYLEDALERSSNIEDIIDRLLREDDLVRKYLDENNIKYNANLDTYKELRELAKKNGISKYLSEKLNDVIGEKGIYNGKEYLTEAGNRRTFWQLHDKYNIENLVKNLTKGKTTGTQQVLFGAGFGPTQANMYNQFKSIDDIKNSENKIVTKEEQEKSNTEYMIKLENAMKPLRQYAVEGIYTTGSEQVYNVVQELSQEKNVNVENLKKILKEHNFNNVDSISSKTLTDVVDSLNDLKNMPTDYFEAKPQRAVGLDEIGVAVIPNTWSQETKQRMTEKNIRYVEYDPSIEGDRQRVENKFDDLKFSKDNQTWREYLEKEFLSQGTRTNLQGINERNKSKQENKTTQEEKPQEMPKNDVKQEVKKSYLTSAEQNELENLRELDNTGLLDEKDADYKRLQELERKSQGITTKYPELKAKNTFDDIKSIYGKYKNNEISKSNKEILNKAKSFIDANSQGRRTIEQWKSIAEFIGSNADIKNSQDLQRLAIETWHEQKPNSKEQLNRQGKKYVPFAVQDWVNAVYKGAGVGTDVKMSIEEATDSKGNKVDLKPTGNKTYEEINVKPKKTDVIPDMSNKVLNIGNEKVSNFYSNITEKSKFITEENRETLKDNANLKYYDAITNKDTLESAMNKLDKNAEQQVGDFFAKKDFNAEDVATGWILVKRYQDAGNFEAMSNVIEKMREQGTKAGQAVQAYGILQRLTPEGMEYYSQKQLDKAFNEYSKNKSKKQIEKYAKDFTLTAKEHQFIKDTMKKVEKMKDEEAKKVEIAKIVSMLSDKMPPERGQRLKAWMRISMLGNPKTQVRNVVGNAIIQPVNWVGDIFAATADKIMAKQTGKRTIGTTDFGALARGTKQGLKDAIRDAKTGVDTRDINLDRFDENIGSKPFYEGHNSKLLNTAAKALNKTNKILGNIMSGGDRIFYQGIYENSLANQMKLNNVTKPTQEMKNIAEQEALSRTWNDSNEYTKAVLQIRNAMNKLNVKGYGLGDVLVPFAKTPANLTKAIVDYSPVGLTRSILQDGKNYKNSLENGQYSPELQHKFAESLGKGMAGSLLYVAAAALAKAGITSGASDDDKDVSNFMRNTLGIQPYSVKIGDKSFTYDWAQPIAAPFAIMADAKRISEKENQELGDIITTATSSASNILLEQSFLSSIQDVFNSYEGPSAAIKQQIQDLPARATPTFFKQIADLIDPTSRQTFVKGNEKETLKNKVQVKIPGASKELVSQRDTLGREIKKYGGKNNFFNVFLNPANTNKGKKSEAAEEIYSIYKATGDKTIMPRQVGYSENIGGSIRNLTAKERNELQKLSGQKIEENVKALTQSSKYNSMSNEDKAAVINGIVNYSFAKAKSDLFDTNISTMYKTAAKKEEQGIPLYDYYINRVSKRR